MDLKIHFLHHIPESILRSGPAYNKSCFPFERLWHHLNKKLTKRDTPEASIAMNYAASRAALACGSVLLVDPAESDSSSGDSDVMDPANDEVLTGLPGLSMETIMDPYLVPVTRVRGSPVKPFGTCVYKDLSTDTTLRVQLHRFFQTNFADYSALFDRFLPQYYSACLPAVSAHLTCIHVR